MLPAVTLFKTSLNWGELDVLVVEDHPDIREMLRIMLTRWGCPPRLASNGEEALLLVDERAPDVVLLDMALPKLDGFELARRLRMNPKTCTMTIIAITALGQESDRRRCLEAGCSDYLAKPFSTQVVRERLEVALKAKVVASKQP